MSRARVAALDAEERLDEEAQTGTRTVEAIHRLYPAIAIVALADIVLTTRILQLGGVELNGFANAILQQAGIPGLVLLKICSVLVVIACCELIARRNERSAHRLAEWGVALNFIPVAVGFSQILLVLV